MGRLFDQPLDRILISNYFLDASFARCVKLVCKLLVGASKNILGFSLIWP